MPKNYFEIKDSTFVASEKNKVVDFNLKIEKPGQIICLLGPSGVGKTTILRSIAGLQKIPKGCLLGSRCTVLHVDFIGYSCTRVEADCWRDQCTNNGDTVHCATAPHTPSVAHLILIEH